MERCHQCKKNDSTIHTQIDGESISLCLDCYNAILAEELGVELLDQVKEVTFRDHAGVLRYFSIVQRVDPAGLFIEAEEKNGYGYTFAIHGELDEDQVALFERLMEKVKQGLDVSYIEEKAFPNGQSYHSLKDDRFFGQIEMGENGGPVIVIDGKPYTWDEVGKMMESYEGFQLKMEIYDPTDDIES
ncbi:DUF7713 domain-containing protein [Halobacillus sp. H74]|uniref:DUF7713 domain-containing protein n=1 Tax=Halobacillus sp. H74 TaxID=3457436 RepID=UPI003FCD6526